MADVPVCTAMCDCALILDVSACHGSGTVTNVGAVAVGSVVEWVTLA